jgi:hypothetical protein
MLTAIVSLVLLLAPPAQRPTAATPHAQKPFQVGMTVQQATRVAHEQVYHFKSTRFTDKNWGQKPIAAETWHNTTTGEWPLELQFGDGILKKIVPNFDRLDVASADLVAKGMDRETVIDILDTPDEDTSASDGSTRLWWAFKNGEAAVYLKNGVVARIVKQKLKQD